MATCSPQRYLANDRNLVRDAVLTPSSVLPVEDQVVSIPVARRGTAEVLLTGAYDGAEEATYDVEIVDTTPDDSIVSAPVFTGAGSSRLVDVAATSALNAQTITVELIDAGRPARAASVSFEGVSLKARTEGDEGNDLRIAIDQSGLTFAPSNFAVLEDLRAGSGGPTGGFEGAGFDWETAILGADNLIPASAKRVAFGADRSTIYLAYKTYVDNRWTYHFVPELKRDVSKGTPVYFVTGGRTVTVSDDGITADETYPGIVTVYDILNAIRNTSALLEVDGVVANDRTPGGQASRELLVRTDAHVMPSTGSGSASAIGFVDAFANSNARTELVIAKCYAVSGTEHPLARLGAERWRVTTSLAGDIGEAITNVPFVEAESRFGFTIPRRLPTSYGTRKGRFDLVEIRYQPRDEGVDPPPICQVSMTLGPEAVDQRIILRWTRRPSGDCDCSGMPKPRLGGKCLGIESEEGDDDMAYSNANRERLKAFYAWYADSVRANSFHELETGGMNARQDPAYSQPGIISSQLTVESEGNDPEPLRDIVALFEQCLFDINELAEGESPDLRGEGEEAWDDAVQEFIDDVDAVNESGGTPGHVFVAAATDRYKARINQVYITAGISPLGKSEASAVDSGDGCWRDWGDAFYFTVEGSVRGGYAPLFPNHPYYSSARANQEGKYFSTKEYALQVNIKPECIDQLIEGDEVELAIGDAGFPATYQVGDELVLPVIAAADLHLAGGRDDDATQTWSVFGTDHGPFASWQFVPGGSGTAYSDAGLSFDIEPGGIENEDGDRFTFDIEGGHYRWRKNAGAWSSAIGIPTAPALFDSGLSIEFVPGAAPSFFAGDLHSFRALQPWAVSNVTTPHASRWQWATDSPDVVTLDIDVGSVEDLDTLALARHTIPEGATIELEGGPTFPPSAWTEPVTWREFLTVQPLSEARTARYLRLTITDGAGGGIGWLWAGVGLSTTLSAEVQRPAAFRVLRSGAPLDQGGTTLGKGRGATVQWTEGGLAEADVLALDAMVEYVKGNDDEPLIVLPHTLHPGEAIIGHIEADELEFEELSGLNRNDADDRRYTTSFRVAPVWR